MFYDFQNFVLIMQLEVEDTKVVIRSRKFKKVRQYNVQTKIHKRTNNYLQTITLKTKDRVTRTPLQIGSECRCSGRVSSSYTRCVTLVTHTVTSHEWGESLIVITTNRAFLIQILRSHCDDRKTFEVMAST
jgi:hypothetical protein